MKFTLRFRLASLALLIIILALMIGGAAYVTTQHVRALRVHFNDVQGESFRIADYLQESILKLNATLLRCALQHDPGDWEKFSKESQGLIAWMDAQKPATIQERKIIEEIGLEFRNYRGKADQIEAEGAGQNLAGVTEEVSKIERASQKLLDLGYDLALAHRKGTEQLFSNAQRSLTHLQSVIFTSLLLLVAFGSCVILIVYRETIAPLRLKLIENQVTLERQEKLASLGVLAAGVAHEIRNPLSAIKACTYLLKESVPAESHAKKDILMIESEITRLERIVRDVLAFARPNDPILDSVSTTALMAYVWELISGQFAETAIELILESSPDITIKADENQLTQVLLNLIRNAGDSIEGAGKIILRVRTDRANLSGLSINAVILEVEDTGKGISPEVQKRLFDPFYTTKSAGTGLGLSIAARIIERHGGALQYCSQVNHGTTFGIVLPLAQKSDM